MKTVALSIEARLIKTSIATWICTLITMLIQLVSVPICLHFWGKETYGIWLAILAAFGLMRTIDYGYTLYVGNKINILYHINVSKMRVILASSIVGVTALGILQVLFLIFLYLTNSMSLILGYQHSQFHNVEVFIALLIMSLCWISSASFIGIVHRLLNPVGMLYQSTWMMMWLQVAQFIVVIIAAILNLNILQTSIVYSITTTIFYLLSAAYVKSLLPQYYPWWKGNNAKFGLLNIIRSIPLTLGFMMTQGGTNALVLLISAILSPVMVPAFTTLRTISNLWTTLINSFVQPMIPEAIRFHANKEWHKLVALNHIHWILVSALCNLSILIIFPFLNIIFTAWTGHHLHFDKSLLCMLLASTLVSGMSTLMGTFFNSVNHNSFIIISSSIRGILVLILSGILLTKYGTIGIGISIFGAEILVLFLTLYCFITQILTKIGGTINLAFFGWSWVSFISIITFLITECFHFNFQNIIYILVILIVIICTFLDWHNLDAHIKDRIKSLVYNKLVGSQ